MADYKKLRHTLYCMYVGKTEYERVREMGP